MNTATLLTLWLLWIGVCFVAASGDDTVSSLLSVETSIFQRQQTSIVRSKARIVVPKVEDLSLQEDYDDLLPSSASELWDEIDYQDGLFRRRQHQRKQHDPISSDFDLALHLETTERDSLQTPAQETQQDLKSYCKMTGTTIAGCVVNTPSQGPYVILAADTRATNGNLVADKMCSKIHPLASNCWCCGAGTSGDLDKVTRQVLYSMALRELHRSSVGNGDVVTTNGKGGDGCSKTSAIEPSILYQQGYAIGDEDDKDGQPLIFLRPVSIPAICNTFQDTLFRAQGNLGANLILGGVWQGRGYLRAIHPHGSMDVGLPFAALGSGGLAAMAMLEEGYRDDLTLEEGIKLVQRAIVSGIRNDLGSGSQVDMCVISPDGSSRHTRCVVPEEVLENFVLEGSKQSSSSDSKVEGDEKESPSASIGVNGFGNSPFAIESTRQRVVSIETDEERRKSTWDKALGF